MSLRPPRLHHLPNKMEIAYQSRAEVEFFYKDIFEKEIYLQHGIVLKDGDCVFDVGANIGFFTLFAYQKCRPSALFAFEPAPAVFEALRYNTARYAPQARLFNCGISDRNKVTTFTFYPNSSGLSSFYADREEEQKVLRTIMLSHLKEGRTGMDRVWKHADDLLEERLRSESFKCKLRTLSDVIQEYHVRQIDLLKIDVQKSEMDVLAGIADEDWKNIRQIVVEVHDLENRLESIVSMLQGYGYSVEIEQETQYEGSINFNLYATRKTALTVFDAGLSQQPNGHIPLLPLDARIKKQGAALHRQKQLANQRKKNK